MVFPGPPVSSTNKTDYHDITEILLKVAVNTIKQTNKQKLRLIVKSSNVAVDDFVDQVYFKFCIVSGIRQ